MEPELAGAHEDQLHADFAEYYRKALQEPGLSEECRKLFEDTMNSHKRLKLASDWMFILMSRNKLLLLRSFH